MILRSHFAPIAAAILVAPLASQVGLKHALPESTILYVGAPDISMSVAEMKEMPLMRMWREPEVQDFFADALAMAEAEWNKGLEQGRAAHEQGMLPFNPDDLLGLRMSGAAFAITQFDVRMGGDRPYPHFGVVAQLDFGETAAGWRKLLDFGTQMLVAQSQGMLTRTESDVGDTKLITFKPPMTDMSLNMAYVGSGLVIGTDHDEVKSVLTHMASGTKVLTASENYKSTFKHLDENGAELESYMQPGAALDSLMTVLRTAKANAPGFPEQLDVDGIDRAITALGLRAIKGIGGTESYGQHDDGTKAVSKGFMHVPAPERRGLLGGTDKTIGTEFLRWVPKDAASFSAMSFDLSSIYSGLEEALKAYNPQLAEGLLGQLAQHESQFGISIKDDLIGSFGNEMVTWSMPVAAFGSMPEMAILMQVKDEAKLLNTLETMAKLSRGMVEIDKSERRGITVYTLQINYDPTGGGGMGMNPLDMFVPTFSFKDGYLVAGFSTGDVKRTFKRMDREDDPEGDIRSNPEFKPYLASLPKDGLNSVSFTDWKANFEGMYQMVTSMAMFIPTDDSIPIDLALLPDVATLTQHLFGSVSYAKADGEGFHVMSQGPWGPETTVPLVGGIAAGVGVFGAMESGAIRMR